MDQNPISRCQKLLEKFLSNMEEKGALSADEARLVLDIRESLNKMTIIALGDTEAGFIASAEHYDKMRELIQQGMKDPWHSRIILWNDLISAINIGTDETEVVP